MIPAAGATQESSADRAGLVDASKPATIDIPSTGIIQEKRRRTETAVDPHERETDCVTNNLEARKSR